MQRSSFLLAVLVLVSTLSHTGVHCQDLCPTIVGGREYPNLTSLRATSDYTALDSLGYSYSWNFCGPSVSFPVCGGVENTDVCQNGNSSPKSAGTTINMIITSWYKSSTVNSVSFFSTGGSPSSSCVAPRSTNITVTCVPGSPTVVIGTVIESTAIPQGATFSCLYLINMQSGDVCPSNSAADAPLDSSQAVVLAKLQGLWGAQLGWEGSATENACSWQGVTCVFGSENDGLVVGLNLSATNISGSLPDAIGSLTTLQTLDLSANNLTGPIPASYAQLPRISILALNNNGLSGSIPDFEQTSPIASLSLQFNQLTGGFPKSLAQLKYLDNLYLQSNQLAGAVPNFVCILSSYNLQRNSWSCPVPACCGTIGNSLCLPCFSS